MSELNNKREKIVQIILVVFTIIGVGLSIIYVFNFRPFGISMMETEYLQYLVLLFLSPVFLIYPANRKIRVRDKIPIYDIVIFFIIIGITFYFGRNALKAITYGWEYSAPEFETILSIVMWLIIVEGIRRVSGTPLAIMVLFFSTLPLYADKMPGFLNGVQSGLFATARSYYLGMEGVFGIPLRTVGTQLIGFMLFGAALEVTGASKFLLDLTSSFFGKKPGGSAKIAVISSGLFGSLSGSVISNIATIGSFVIPEMKESGYSSEYAGAVACSSSTGGALMPPVMGAAAFIMASFLKIPYIEVAKAAFLPSLLYYLTLFVQTDARAKRLGLKGKKEEDVPGKLEAFKGGWYYIFAFLTLIYFMAYLKVENRSPFYATIVLFILAMFKKETRITKETLLKFIKSSGKILIELTAILSAIGLIVGGLTITGVSQAFSRELVSLVGDNVFLLLIAAAVTSAILGMGMTVTACYTFLAIVVAPALINLGINPIGAHLFVLYWGLVSYITPPVAVGAITAAGISGGDPVKTGFLSMKLGVASYIVPFAFVYSPALIWQGNYLDVLLTLIFTVIGITIIGYMLEGYIPMVGDLTRKWTIRIPMFICGTLLLFPQLNLKIISLIAFIIIFVIAKKANVQGDTIGI